VCQTINIGYFNAADKKIKAFDQSLPFDAVVFDVSVAGLNAAVAAFLINMVVDVLRV